MVASNGSWGKANAVKDTTTWEKPRSLDNLPEFLETFSDDPKKLQEAPKKKGSPHTIIVAGAGLRAANIVRQVYTNPDCTLSFFSHEL